MQSKKERQQYIDLLNREVKPALGCTEPIAVALAVAKAAEILREKNEKPAKITVEVSANILKNAMGVGIPGTGMNGLYIASALGACCGKSIYGLEVLKDLKSEDVCFAKNMVDSNRVEIKLSPLDIKLYIKASCWSTNHITSATICNSHDEIVETTIDGEKILTSPKDSNKKCSKEKQSESTFELGLTISSIFEFATTAPIEEIEFIKDASELNLKIANEGLKNGYGLQVGKTIRNRNHSNIFGAGILPYAMSLTAAAADARMAGCTLPAMSNSGSGNQGITVTLPVIACAEKMGSSREQIIRALIISHLTAIHIKSYLGRLSALCGCVVASTGAACGITYLMGGEYKEITFAIKNMIGNITGMVCDGAKAGCALKVSSGTSSAVQSAILAVDNICISENDGIIENDIEKTIYNLGKIGSTGMQNTDNIMLNIMINKKNDMPVCS
ncbi:MAG: L-serine ammonia-lyase, iron-sulfur-dependent, subunit alpha [Bacteroidales bacterium]|nr:L-serine ammonia-lyase, iron-sulfur-dependent, subunit alpha [Bacteroidales bacterium]